MLKIETKIPRFTNVSYLQILFLTRSMAVEDLNVNWLPIYFYRDISGCVKCTLVTELFLTVIYREAEGGCPFEATHAIRPEADGWTSDRVRVSPVCLGTGKYTFMYLTRKKILSLWKTELILQFFFCIFDGGKYCEKLKNGLKLS